MRCLVTGAAGFIGSHLAGALVAEGHDVVGLDDLSQGSLENLADAPEVELTVGDVRDQELVARVARGCSVIFHQAAVRSVPRSMAEPALATSVNVLGTLSVLIAAQATGARVVSASSSSVYGHQAELPMRESAEPRPHSPYAVSKLAAEQYCATWWRAYRVPAVSLRYFNVYGPRQDPTNPYALVIPIFALTLLEGRRPIVHGDGEQARDFTFVGDVVEANILAARAPERALGRAFNVGGGQTPTSINELLDRMASLLGVEAHPLHTESRAGDMRRTAADPDLAWSELGFRARTSLDEGLPPTVAWFRDRYPAVLAGGVG